MDAFRGSLPARTSDGALRLSGLGGSDVREFAKHANLRRLDYPDALLSLTDLRSYGDRPGKALKFQIRAFTLEIVPPNFAVAHRKGNGGPIFVWGRADNIPNINADVCPRGLKPQDRDGKCENGEGCFGHCVVLPDTSRDFLLLVRTDQALWNLMQVISRRPVTPRTGPQGSLSSASGVCCTAIMALGIAPLLPNHLYNIGFFRGCFAEGDGREAQFPPKKLLRPCDRLLRITGLSSRGFL
jgi:hypothetical protein